MFIKERIKLDLLSSVFLLLNCFKKGMIAGHCLI